MNVFENSCKFRQEIYFLIYCGKDHKMRD